jgi:hypothetical protein
MRLNTSSILRLAFHSRAVPWVVETDLLAIVQRSWQHNVANRVFGLLEFRNGRFSQVIEAEVGVMNGLMPAILSDARHEMIDLTAVEQIRERTFTQWMVTGFDDLDITQHATGPGPAQSSNVIFVDRFGARGRGRRGVVRGDAVRNDPNGEN